VGSGGVDMKRIREVGGSPSPLSFLLFFFLGYSPPLFPVYTGRVKKRKSKRGGEKGCTAMTPPSLSSLPLSLLSSLSPSFLISISGDKRVRRRGDVKGNRSGRRWRGGIFFS